MYGKRNKPYILKLRMSCQNVALLRATIWQAGHRERAREAKILDWIQGNGSQKKFVLIPTRFSLTVSRSSTRYTMKFQLKWKIDNQQKKPENREKESEDGQRWIRTTTTITQIKCTILNEIILYIYICVQEYVCVYPCVCTTSPRSSVGRQAT